MHRESHAAKSNSTYLNPEKASVTSHQPISQTTRLAVDPNLQILLTKVLLRMRDSMSPRSGWALNNLWTRSLQHTSLSGRTLIVACSLHPLPPVHATYAAPGLQPPPAKIN